MFTLDLIRFLATDPAQDVLDALSAQDLGATSQLRLLESLRRDFSPEESAALLETAVLRHKAAAKFPRERAHRMLFTRDALEQASHPLVRAYRATDESAPLVLDLGCGIGADALSFAAAGADVLGLELDPVRAAMASFNAAALGLEDRMRVVVADLRDGLPTHAPDALRFFDPARRDAQGRRLHSVESYQPPLSMLRRWAPGRYQVKLSPAVDLAQLAHYTGPGARLDFIAVAGREAGLKEAVLHVDTRLMTGGTRPLSPLGIARRAVLLMPDGRIHTWERRLRPPERPLSTPRHWLIEPDPSLLRAGLVQDAAAYFDAYQLDSTTAYLTADQHPDSPWVRAWEVLEWLPFNLKGLRAALKAQQVGQVTVKKRGFPMQPDEVIAKLKLKPREDPESRTLVLTRAAGEPVALICADKPIAPAD